MMLVTGGAGYIGSHFLLTCLDAGIEPVVLDNLSTGKRSAVPKGIPFEKGEVADRHRLDQVFRRYAIDAVVHFAARISVPDSFRDPAGYYRTNTLAAATLLDACEAHGVERFVVSSTAAVYGNPRHVAVTERDAVAPCSPYGRSKLALEWMLADRSARGSMRAAALRYFNVAGADPKGRVPLGSQTGQHLIANVARVVAGRLPDLPVYGTDYATHDGTCIRDFIHVTDLCAAHLFALTTMDGSAEMQVLNCGTGTGISVRDVIRATERQLGRPLPLRLCGRRPGDIPALIAQPDRLMALGWSPKMSGIDQILYTALVSDVSAAA